MSIKLVLSLDIHWKVTLRFTTMCLCYDDISCTFWVWLNCHIPTILPSNHLTSNTWALATALLTRSLFTVAFNHADLDDSMSARMILSGIQPQDEAYLQFQLALMTKEERKGLKQGRIPIDECYNLMGTTDPTGTLKEDQVCVILYASNIHHIPFNWMVFHLCLSDAP